MEWEAYPEVCSIMHFDKMLVQYSSNKTASISTDLEAFPWAKSLAICALQRCGSQPFHSRRNESFGRRCSLSFTKAVEDGTLHASTIQHKSKHSVTESEAICWLANRNWQFKSVNSIRINHIGIRTTASHSNQFGAVHWRPRTEFGRTRVKIVRTVAQTKLENKTEIAKAEKFDSENNFSLSVRFRWSAPLHVNHFYFFFSYLRCFEKLRWY